MKSVTANPNIELAASECLNVVLYLYLSFLFVNLTIQSRCRCDGDKVPCPASHFCVGESMRSVCCPKAGFVFFRTLFSIG